MNVTRFALVFCFLALPSIAVAKGGHKKKWREMIEQLDLTEDQKSQLKEIRQSLKGTRREQRSTLKNKRDILENLLRDDAPESEIRKAHNELQTIKQALMLQRFEKMMSIRAILNAEQRQKFHELRPRRKGRHGNDRP